MPDVRPKERSAAAVAAEPARRPDQDAAAADTPDLALDKLVHEPARLAILTVLSSARDADFTFLLRATGLTKGNLSSHLAKLEEGGLVAIEKRFVGRKPNTTAALTALGRERIARHWEQLDQLRGLAGG